jgi:hypothetical protein
MKVFLITFCVLAVVAITLFSGISPENVDAGFPYAGF